MTIVGATPPPNGKGGISHPILFAPRHSAPARGVAPTLWHYTCKHQRSGIIAVGALIPNQHPLLPRLCPLVWLTTEEIPDRVGLGLTAEYLRCDRSEERFLVAEYESVLPWLTVVALAPPRVLDARIVRRLHQGRHPETWWVSASPVPVIPA